MSSFTISSFVFAGVFGGALIGMLLHAVLPEHHLNNETKDIVKLGMGLVGTMAALLLGLLVAAAKNSYDAQNSELTQISANIALLDRVLAHYGPETAEIRNGLRNSVTRISQTMWPQDGSKFSSSAPPVEGVERLFDSIPRLGPRNDEQRYLKQQALSLTMDIAKIRWLMYEQETVLASLPLLTMVGVWLSLIFISFGLFAPFNGTAVSSLFVSSVSVSGAIFLILEMYTPYTGVIAISGNALRAALAQLGQ
jgi:hypothetical protein